MCFLLRFTIKLGGSAHVWEKSPSREGKEIAGHGDSLEPCEGYVQEVSCIKRKFYERRKVFAAVVANKYSKVAPSRGSTCPHLHGGSCALAAASAFSALRRKKNVNLKARPEDSSKSSKH